jgi:WD40 repeat protein
MVAHLDSVTSLAVDHHGLYLISGSHDCSIRLWNLESKTCVQEITAHRKKFDESIFDVAFHPSRPYIASAGCLVSCKLQEIHFILQARMLWPRCSSEKGWQLVEITWRFLNS